MKRAKTQRKPKPQTDKLTADQQEKYDAFVTALYDPAVSDAEVAKKQKSAVVHIPDIAASADDIIQQEEADAAAVDGFDDFLHNYAFQQNQNPDLLQKKPTNLKSVAAVLIESQNQGKKVRAAGSGHSYSDVSVGNDVFVDTHGMNKLGWPLRKGPGPAKFQGQLRQNDYKVAWQWSTMKKKWKNMKDVKIKGGVITHESSPADIRKVRRVAEGNKQLIETQAGIRLQDLNEKLKDLDLGLPNMGGYDGQTLAGVISTSTHGAGITLGPFPDIVKSLVLVTTGKLTEGRIVSGSGRNNINCYRIEPTNGITNAAKYKKNQSKYRIAGHDIQLVQDDNIFNAVKCNFGTMGIIGSVVIEVIQKYYMTETVTVTTLKEVMKGLKPNPKNPRNLPDKLFYNRNYSWMVCPYAVELGKNGGFKGNSKLEKLPTGGLTPAQYENIRVAEIVRNITPKPKGFVETERTTKGDKEKLKFFRGIANTIQKFPRIAPGTVMTALLTMGRKDKVDIYHQIYLASTPAGAGWATEMGFPVQTSGSKPNWTSKPLLTAIKSVTDQAHKDFRKRRGGKRVLTGPYAVRFVAQSPAYMSMMHNRYTVMIELDMLSGSPHGVEVVNGHQDQMMKLPNARPHWGLEFSHWKGNPAKLASMYPMFPKWYSVYQQLNSKGTFENGTTKRLGLQLNKPKPATAKTKKAKEAPVKKKRSGKAMLAATAKPKKTAKGNRRRKRS